MLVNIGRRKVGPCDAILNKSIAEGPSDALNLMVEGSLPTS